MEPLLIEAGRIKLMGLSENLAESYAYAKKLLSDVGRLILLIVLNAIPIVQLIVVGYNVRVIKTTPSEEEPPKLENYREKWLDGLKVFVAFTVYLVVPIAILSLGAISVLSRFLPVPGGFIQFSFGIGAILILVGIISLFLVLIVASMAVAHMIKRGRFGAAFAIGEIIGIIGRVGWGKYMLWLLVIFALSLLVGGLGAIPYAGWLLTLMASPILSVFLARSTALIYEEGAPGLGPAAGVSQSLKYCIYCGGRIPADYKFCSKCGQPVS